MLTIEKEIHKRGFKNIACIDEVGRGCLLGDVLACAVIMKEGQAIEGVKDSKKISPKKREKLYDIIKEEALGIGIGRVDAAMIDKINIKQATLLAMERAVDNIVDSQGKKITPDYLLIDAENIRSTIPQTGLTKGDEKCHGISAASILAKVYRDRLCLEWDDNYPGYGIAKHKGYGTKQHREMILELGVTPIHRRSFLTKILSQK